MSYVPTDKEQLETDVVTVQWNENNSELALIHNYSGMTSNREVSDMEECFSGNETGGSRGTKRNRELDEDEMWNTVGRKGKPAAQCTNENNLNIIADDKSEVSITCTEKLPKQICMAKMLKSENIQKLRELNTLTRSKH